MAESVRLRIPGGGRFRRAASRFGPWLPGLGPGLERLGRVDLVHSANVAFESMMMACSEYARRKGIPHLVTPFVHLGEGPGSKVRRYYTMPHQLELVRSASAVLALTSIEADFLVKSGVDPRRVHVVGAGIDVGAVTGGSAARARLRNRLSGAVVLSLGAAAYDKGTIHLSEAVRRLRRRGVDVTLVVAGPTLAEYDAYLQRIDRDEREGIRCLGYVDNGARRDLLAAADVLALPSRTESFGLVFHEAWANGKPVIGARAGAIPAVVCHGDDGLLVQFGDVDGLTHSLSLLLSDPRARDEMGRRGRAKIVTERDWLDRVRGVYEQLLGGPLTVMGKLEGTRDGSLSALGG